MDLDINIKSQDRFHVILPWGYDGGGGGGGEVGA